MIFPVRLFVIIIALITSYVLYNHFVYKSILYPLCLVETNQCVQISYYKINNSILFNMEPTGYWCWFNGKNAYMYGIVSGHLCKNTEYEPDYVINLSSPSAAPMGYECIQNLNSLIEYYKSNTTQQYIFYRSTTPYQTTVYDILNFMNNRNIISI